MTYVAKSGCFLQYKMHFIMLSTAVHWWVSYTITLHFQFQYYTIAVITENFLEFRRLGKNFLGCKNGGIATVDWDCVFAHSDIGQEK